MLTDLTYTGLFAPRAGQNFRDEQRRRRSQYDRGTRMAQIEDSYHDHHHHRHDGSDQISQHYPHHTVHRLYSH